MMNPGIIPYLSSECDEDHVLVGGGVSDDLHVFHDVIEGRHQLHEVMAGHGGRDGQDTEHGTAPHVLCK